MMITQSNTIADLTATIANLTQQIQKATVRINTLKITKVPETPKDRPPKWVNGKHISDTVGYCCTHGYCVDMNHNSEACQSKNGVFNITIPTTYRRVLI